MTVQARRGFAARILVGVSAVALCAGGGVSAAGADEAASNWAQVQANLNYFQVPAALQETIRAKYEAGEVLDAFTGAAPVSTDVVVRGESKWTVERFADGSYDATSIQGEVAAESSGRQARGINGCRYSMSAGVATYSNCRADKNMVYLSMAFTITYSQWSGGSSIGSASNWDIQAIGASCSKAEFGVTASRGYSSASPAVARLKASCTMVTGIASSTPYIEARIAPTSASVAANW